MTFRKLSKLRRFFWPATSVLLAAQLVMVIADPQRAVTPHKRSKAESFSSREKVYFNDLAETVGYPVENLTAADAARLAALLNVELNKQRSLARTGTATFAMRSQVFTHPVSVPVQGAMRFALPKEFTHYQYELRNISIRAQPAPILFQDVRWDTAPELVKTAGLSTIPDELDRALAIWRFVCEHRAHSRPVTEGSEEHDLVKFLSAYGYGFCDDAARAVSALASACGLKARVWLLQGHVVAEVFAGGHWRMLDADQQVYFHRSGESREVLGLEELSRDRSAFGTMVSLTGATSYRPDYIDAFLSRDDNEVIENGTVGFEVRPVLRPGERMVFTSFNWGRYFLGQYPQMPPAFFNGFFEYRLLAADSTTPEGRVEIAPAESGLRIVAADRAVVEWKIESPFPIVGGEIVGAGSLRKGKASWRLEQRSQPRVLTAEWRDRVNISLNGFAAVLAKEPTRAYTLQLVLEPQTEVELRDVRVISDFQFAELALLKLRTGDNACSAFFPSGGDPAAFELRVQTR